MKIAHLAERIEDYKASIKTVVDKKTLWNTKVRPLLTETLRTITNKYSVGWKVQELNWMYNNEAVNITFDSFPHELMDCTNQIPAYQFIPGGALVFSQSYSGDVYIFVLFPYVENMPNAQRNLDLGVYAPQDISEKLIVEKVDEFLKEMIKWDIPTSRSTVGFQNEE